MNPRPIAILDPTLGNVMSGTCTRLRRLAGGALKQVAVGDRLWVREAYYLNERFDAISPTAAWRHHAAWPIYAHEHWRRLPPRGLGIKRSARELLRVWHRAHLVVTGVERLSLKSISGAEARAEGYPDRFAWAEAWNRSGFTGWGRSWSDNPEVVVFDFRYVAEPLPAPEADTAPLAQRDPRPRAGQTKRERQRELGSERKADRARRLAEFEAAQADARAEAERAQRTLALPTLSSLDAPLRATADGRTWCDQCQLRVDPEVGRACRSPFCRYVPDERRAIPSRPCAPGREGRSYG